MKTRCEFYLEPYEKRGEYKRMHKLLADWHCGSEEMVHYAQGMAMGCALRYKRFRIVVYDYDTGNLVFETKYYR